MLAILLQAAGDGNMTSTFIMFGVIIIFYVFFILLPQRKRSKEQKSFFDAIKPGDMVVTIGGMHGKIVSIDDNIILLEIDRNVRVKIDKTALDTSRLNVNKSKTITTEKTEKTDA